MVRRSLGVGREGAGGSGAGVGPGVGRDWGGSRVGLDGTGAGVGREWRRSGAAVGWEWGGTGRPLSHRSVRMEWTLHEGRVRPPDEHHQ